MNSTDTQMLPRWLLWTILIAFTALICLAASEIFLRIVSGPWSNSFFHVYDPVVGTWHLRDFTGDNASSDYAVRGIHFNSYGMRDRERSLAEPAGIKTRIAVLGDSFIEGVQVADDQILTRQMEKMLGTSTEVLNFGASGFGTVQEYLAYRDRVRQFHPDIVVLAFYTGNDVRNNSQPLEDLYNGGPSPRPYVGYDQGEWKITPVPEKVGSQNPAILFLKRHLALYRFLWFERQSLSERFAKAAVPAKPAENMNVYLARLFAPPAEEPFTDAWAGTEFMIQNLKEEVKRNSGRFVLVAIPDPVSMEKNPKAALEKLYGESLPENYDVEYPQKRLAAFSAKQNIAYLDLTPAFKAYRDEHALSFPYFSFAHDGHWSVLGHTVAARALAAYLQQL